MCKKCELLWQEYGHATGQHATLVLDRMRHPRDGNAVGSGDVDLAISAAQLERRRIRRLISDHEASVHGSSASPAFALLAD